MPSSISKEQAKALASGFLDTIGSSKEELQPTNTLSALYQLAGGLVVKAQENLNKSDRVSTGKLSESIKVVDPKQIGKSIRVDIEALDYYKFIDAGVRGTKGGTSSAGYSYKDKMPPVDVVRKWILREGLKHRVDKYNVTNREVRRASFRKTITSIEGSVRGLAFAIARSIQRKGLKQTNFMVKAIIATQAEAKKELTKAFRVDIINAIPTKL